MYNMIENDQNGTKTKTDEKPPNHFSGTESQNLITRHFLLVSYFWYLFRRLTIFSKHFPSNFLPLRMLENYLTRWWYLTMLKKYSKRRFLESLRRHKASILFISS